MVGEKGGRSGPNLSRAGRQRSYAYLRASIIDPSADITPGYSAVSVVLRGWKEDPGAEARARQFHRASRGSGRKLPLLRQERCQLRDKQKSAR